MSVAETYENFADGGVILWSTDLENAPIGVPLNFKVQLVNGAVFPGFGERCANGDFEILAIPKESGKVIAWCRGPHVSGSVAYQLGDPGEGLGS